MSEAGESFRKPFIVGGSALVALDLVRRPTRDIDVAALGAGDQLVSAEPFPPALVEPTVTELLQAARWTRTHDPSDGFREVLERVLEHLGVPHGRRGD